MLINNSTQVFTKELAAISRLETKCVYDKFEMLVIVINISLGYQQYAIKISIVLPTSQSEFGRHACKVSYIKTVAYGSCDAQINKKKRINI